MAWKRTRAKVQQLKRRKKEKERKKSQPCISLASDVQGRFCDIKNTSDTKPNCTTGLPKNVVEFLKCPAHVISWRHCKEKSD